MKITYSKEYTEQTFQHFKLYHNLHFNTTKVFWEYYNLIKACCAATKEEIEKIIKQHKPTVKSKLRISYTDNEIGFYKVEKYIFPEFYITFLNYEKSRN